MKLLVSILLPLLAGTAIAQRVASLPAGDRRRSVASVRRDNRLLAHC